MSEPSVTTDALNMLMMVRKKEENAYDFYTRASEMSKLSNVKDLFQELAAEELKHKEAVVGYIEKFKADAGDWTPPEDAEDTEDIGFSKYLVQTKLTDETTYQDALIIAMKREERSFVLFSNFYSIVKDDELKQLFKRLMNDEINHLKKIETRYDEEVLKDN